MWPARPAARGRGPAPPRANAAQPPRAGARRGGEESAARPGEPQHQLVPGSGLGVHEALGECEAARRAALDGVAGERERCAGEADERDVRGKRRSEEHTSELQSQSNLVCRLLLEKKKKTRA